MGLQKYNQRLLAIIGTLLIATLIVSLLFAISLAIMDSFDDDFDDNSITVNPTNDTTLNPLQLRQDITYGDPRIIDSLESLYLISVSQVNLENNYINDNEGAPIERYNGKSLFSKKSFRSYRGNFNNIILYNQLENTKTILFDKKIFINSFSNHEIESTHYLLIAAALDDSNKDGKLNNVDLRGFFIYNIDTHTMKEFVLENHSFSDFYIPFNSNEILLDYSVDKNNNGRINFGKEPNVIKKLNINNWELNDFIDVDSKNKLQLLIN